MTYKMKRYNADNTKTVSLCRGPVPSVKDRNYPCWGPVLPLGDHYDKQLEKVKHFTGAGSCPFQHSSSIGDRYATHGSSSF